MKRLLHISDLHFGAVNDKLTDPLLDLAQSFAPDAVVVSGDLTQRAKPAEFAAAAAYLARFDRPVVVVPGNHDAPLYNMPLRLLAPFRRYRRAIGPVLEPVLTLPGAVIAGVNTANPLVWKSGRLRSASARHLAKAFHAAAPDLMRVAVLHHAPVPAADEAPADIADPPRVLRELLAAGTDIVLSGHTHMPHFGAAETAAGVLFLQVGTAVSTRLKTAWNDVSLIEIAGDMVTVRPFLAGEACRFSEGTTRRFRRQDGRWQSLNGAGTAPQDLAAQ